MCWFHFNTNTYNFYSPVYVHMSYIQGAIKILNFDWKRFVSCLNLQSHVMKKVKAKAFKMVYRLALQRKNIYCQDLNKSREVINFIHNKNSMSCHKKIPLGYS